MSEGISQDISIRGEGNIVVGKGDVIINPLPPAEARLRHNLGILLKNVETTWIKGVLEKSVHDAALLELGMELREDAVDNPWRMVMEKPDQSREEIPQGRKIKDIFDEANRLLLILGEPGSGKTTTLLRLARDLTAEVDEAFTQPVPVILNLSTWTNKQQPLDEWLVLELSNKYRVPKKDGKKWLQERRILPLLDGLDEVKVENRVACVEKINQLVDDYGLQGMVVCSRIKDYTDLEVRLAFYRAIYIQPLTSEQVDDYLNQAGEKLVRLRSTLQADEALQSMAQSPLILSIMSLAYEDAPAEGLNVPTLVTNEARRKHLFDTYVARMFSRRTGVNEYDVGQTKRRLARAAQNMQTHNQEILLIESLQPSWLSSPLWQWLYIISSRFINGVLCSAIYVIVFWALLKYLWTPNTTIILGPTLVLTPFLGISIGLIDRLRMNWFHQHPDNMKRNFFWSFYYKVLLTGYICSLIFGLLCTLTYIVSGALYYGRIQADFDTPDLLGFGLIPKVILADLVPEDWFFPGLFFGLIFGTIFGLLFGLRRGRQSLENDIQTVEALRWNRYKALRGGLIGISSGLIFGVYLGYQIAFANWIQVGKLDSWPSIPSDLLQISWVCSLAGGLIGAMLNGLQPEIIETKTAPNQGIGLSFRNATSSGLLIGLICGAGGLFFGKGVALMVGLMFGLPIAFWYGGLDIIQHYTLRLIFIIQGHTPRNYARFLDYAVDLIFLQKVGGGYRFIHRMLLEHSAEMYEEKA